MSDNKQYIRKQYVIDKKFQLKTTFAVIGTVTILTGIIIAAIATSVAYNNTKIENINEIEDNVVHFLTSRPQGIDDPGYKNAIKEIAQNHSNNMATLKRIIQYNKILLIILLIFVVVQGTVLYILMIKKTHRISGPVYVISNYIKDIIAGNYPQCRPLRSKDELKDFYELFIQMVDVLRKRAGK